MAKLCFELKLWTIAQWFVSCVGDPVETATAPHHDQVKDRFSVLQSQHLCRLVSACLAFVGTALTKILCTLNIPCSPVCKRWPNVQRHGSTQVTDNSRSIERSPLFGSWLGPVVRHRSIQWWAVGSDPLWFCLCLFMRMFFYLNRKGVKTAWTTCENFGGGVKGVMTKRRMLWRNCRTVLFVLFVFCMKKVSNSLLVSSF